MGEVDDVHHAPDQRQARGEQRVDGTEEEGGDDHLYQKEKHLAAPLAREITVTFR